MLHFLSSQSPQSLWVIFLTENFAVTAIALFAGWATLRLLKKPVKPPSGKEWRICLITNLINTAITFAGFWLWKHNYITFSFDANWRIAADFVVVFILMDLAMYIFHYAIHHSVVYKIIHRFHHQYQHPIPIDLFVLHPLETVSFGALWLAVISLNSFNFYAIAIYLAANVIFGIIGHLGIEPLSANTRNKPVFRYLGTSTFHHTHHLDVNYNFGFYTNLWDKLFRTYKD
ncbi:sterol desaturase family protein [Mucilaginibacter sp.]|uniref:sterol desaturase family protein n=1 Tax=Mucilaginibacter sp. TaxID=1882438 RepID=UPI0025EBDB56|nr:sterol desaturase family protein [Mucilaginibacter sp.]